MQCQYVYFEFAFGDTSAGRIMVRLFADAAPQTSALIVSLCPCPNAPVEPSGAGLSLTGACVRRILPGLLLELDMGQRVLPLMVDEPVGTRRHARHVKGAVSIGRLGALPTQLAPVLQVCLGSAPALDGHHLVVGQVVEGWDTLSKLERLGSLPLGVCSQNVHVISCGQVIEEDEEDE